MKENRSINISAYIDAAPIIVVNDIPQEKDISQEIQNFRENPDKKEQLQRNLVEEILNKENKDNKGTS